MAEPWVALLGASVLVSIGFLAAQVFERFRIPDYVVLITVGIVLGSGVLPLGAWSPEPLLISAQPLLLSVAIAFILFEGGLALHLRGFGRVWGLAALHTVVAIVFSVAGVWLAGVYVLGLASTTSLLLGLAMCAPSAAIVLSVLPRVLVTDRTRLVLTLEGVLGNIVAAALVLAIVRFPDGPPGGAALVPFVLNAAAAFGLAAGVGLAWDRLLGSSSPRSFLYMTSVAIAILLYAVGEGFLGGNGGLAAFAFGLVLGHWGAANALEARLPTMGSRGLQEFHRELVFLLRTFFFVSLGLLINLARITPQSLAAAVLLVIVFVASRLPTTTALGRSWNLPKKDVRVLRAAVARGLTDTVLVLYAITLGVIPAREASLVADLLFMVVLLAAIVSAVLVARADRAGPDRKLGHELRAPGPSPPLAPGIGAPSDPAPENRINSEAKGSPTSILS